MKIYGCWICYNNKPTIRKSILSVHKYLDEIIIIDGNFDGKGTCSNDGTQEEILSLMEELETPIITYRPSYARSLYHKHNEHVTMTGNFDPDVWTWQVDSDEIYLPEHARNVYECIKSNQFNGIGVKLVTVSRIDEEGRYYTHNDIDTAYTTQMRIYRMHNGIHFSTRDGIFEHIIYDNGQPVEKLGNKVFYNNDKLKVFNYHCFDDMEKEVKRRQHYGVKNPENNAEMTRSAENNNVLVSRHPWVLNEPELIGSNIPNTTPKGEQT